METFDTNYNIKTVREIISSNLSIQYISLGSTGDDKIDLLIEYNIKQIKSIKRYKIKSDHILDYFPGIDQLFCNEYIEEQVLWTISFMPIERKYEHIIVLTTRNENKILTAKNIVVDGTKIYKIFDSVLNLFSNIFISVEINEELKSKENGGIRILEFKYNLIFIKIEYPLDKNSRSLCVIIPYMNNKNVFIKS